LDFSVLSGLFYYRESFLNRYLPFFISTYLVHKIMFSLLPSFGVRMAAVKSKSNLKRKGKRRKPYGVPIVLTGETRLTYALNFFKSSLSTSVRGKSTKTFYFKESFVDELISFLFFEIGGATKLKKNLYKSVVEYRSNFHFR